jgi:hypothetical protein
VKLTVQGILRDHLDEFRRRHRLPRYLRNAVLALLSCRTAARGAHVRYCPEGHFQGSWYNSCRHRACPQCAFLDVTRWLTSRLRWLLPSPHYHVVFTLPSALDTLWRYNTKRLTELLFGSARWSLLRLLDDPRYLGAKPGVLAVLHTWGRTLSLHPHLHCLVTAGGLDASGAWRPTRSILVPTRPLGLLFRGHFLRALEALVRSGGLQLPPDMTRDDALWTLKRAASTKWTPRIQHRYSHGRGVMQYLANYVRGGPFRNQSLVAVKDGRVTFRYRNWREIDRDGRAPSALLTLTVDEFLRRLLTHVPRPNTRTVRGWGLYAHTARPALEVARAQLGGASEDPAELVETYAAISARSQCPVYCPLCHRRLAVRRFHLPGRAPPSPRSTQQSSLIEATA